MVLCDSYKDSLDVLKKTVYEGGILLQINEAIVENLKADLDLADAEIEQRDIQINALSEMNKSCDKDRKRLKRKQIIVGTVSGAVGVLVGITMISLIK